AARAGSKPDVLPARVQLRPVGMSGSVQPTRVGEDVLGDRYLTGDLLRRQDGFAVGNRVQLGHGRSGRSPGDLEQLLLRRKGNQQLEEEPIELRLRQRIGSFQ